MRSGSRVLARQPGNQIRSDLSRLLNLPVFLIGTYGVAGFFAHFAICFSRAIVGKLLLHQLYVRVRLGLYRSCAKTEQKDQQHHIPKH